LTEFNDKGFTVVRGLIKDTAKWRKLALENKDKGTHDDKQSPGSISVYKLKYLDELHSEIKDKVEDITCISVHKTYHYYRIYKKGAVLLPHIDRDACEISVSLNLGGDDWAIGIVDNNFDKQETILKEGDALIYHGKNVHYRPGKFEGEELVQIFLHHVDQNGQYAHLKDDKNG